MLDLDFVLDADFREPPFDHQLVEFEQNAERPFRALFWQPRTGKSRAIIDAACHLFRRGMIDGVLIMAPNGVHENWVQRELPRHHWKSVPYLSLAWRTDISGMSDGSNMSAPAFERWKEAHDAWWASLAELCRARTVLPWLAMASATATRDDARKVVRKFLASRRKLASVVDESQDFRTPGATRTKMMRGLVKRCCWRRILTGTPVDNSPLHAFSQFELLQEGALGFDTFDTFKDRYAEYEQKTTIGGRKYPALKGYRNLDELGEKMAAFSSVVLRSDCHDLPDIVQRERVFDLTEDQERVFYELKQSFLIELEEGREPISVGEKAARLMKMQQVTCGFVVDEYGRQHTVPNGNPRLDALLDEIWLSGGPAIVWCNFQRDMDTVAAALRGIGRKVVEYHGRTSAADKQKAREALASGAEDPPDLVGHPQSGGAGLDLSAASSIIWYSHTFDAIIRTQADERATVMGGKNVPVIDLVANIGVDRYILGNVANKISVADGLSRMGMREILSAL